MDVMMNSTAAIVGALIWARGWGRKQVEQGARAKGKN
jgi:hypothetical protein